MLCLCLSLLLLSVGCVRAAEALRKHSYSQLPDVPGQDLPSACSLGAGRALLGSCKCSVQAATTVGFIPCPRSWHALLLLDFLKSFLGGRLQPIICATGKGLEQCSDQVPNAWPGLRLPAVCGL